MIRDELNKTIWLVVIFGTLAAVINLFRLPLFFEAEFVFGPFLVLLVAVFRGPLAGVLTSVIASIPLVIAWGSFWPMLTFGMEAIVVGYVYLTKRINLILIVILYWIIIGMPVSWLAISQYEFFVDSHRTSILIKQLTNAILYAHLTVLLVQHPKVRKLLERSNDVYNYSIKEQSSQVISSLLITIGIVFFLYALNQNIQVKNKELSTGHLIKHQKLSADIFRIFDEKVKAVIEFKYALSQIWDNDVKRAQMLAKFHQRHPEFNTMILIDRNADLINSSPPEFLNNVLLQNEKVNVSDRDYFTETINADGPYVSPGFHGRGFGTGVINAISIGVPDMMGSEKNIGVVEGSIRFGNHKKMNQVINEFSNQIDGLLLDQNDQVLLASTHLKYDFLTQISINQADSVFGQSDIYKLTDDKGQTSEELYYLITTQFNWGWKFITLQKESLFANAIENLLLLFALTIVGFILLARILSWLVSHSWSHSMNRLNQMIEKGNEHDGKIEEFEENEHLPVEVSNLYREIKSSRLEVMQMNKVLQDTVAERTEKLRTANSRLNIMARQDALTHLDNRRVFIEQSQKVWQNCQLNLLSMSMLIIDIDHFKKINDTFGHPVGDDVLIKLAKELKSFNQSSVQCLARLGGEEFCLLFNGTEHEVLKQFAEDIRLHIENTVFHIGADKDIRITVSSGLATIDPTKFTDTKLYQLADNALYEAKNAGRNQVKAVELH